ncbi:hypothetical protein PENFLA_c046G05657 [Penicillium flavigenum]|uniref:Uncharacterized protein n=1 Tax=Penicillium flavigenum TaxID=254877 RepID=A0A1V6SIE4_9EURO|nr:hypothetical protein PENFLA_c046G05657 [Penicillium flavigenum]
MSTDATHPEDGPDKGAESSDDKRVILVPFDLARPSVATDVESITPPPPFSKLKIRDHSANDVTYWESKDSWRLQTRYQNLRSAGFIGIETIDCGPGEGAQTFCWPIASALAPWPRTPTPPLLLLSSNLTGGWYVPIRNE